MSATPVRTFFILSIFISFVGLCLFLPPAAQAQRIQERGLLERLFKPQETTPIEEPTIERRTLESELERTDAVGIKYLPRPVILERGELETESLANGVTINIVDSPTAVATAAETAVDNPTADLIFKLENGKEIGYRVRSNTEFYIWKETVMATAIIDDKFLIIMPTGVLILENDGNFIFRRAIEGGLNYLTGAGGWAVPGMHVPGGSMPGEEVGK